MTENSKPTLVIGGSVKPERYSNKAIRKLTDYGYKVYSLGLKTGEVEGIKIQQGKPALKDIHTVTMYVGPAHQNEYFDYIISLSPERVIFNPGTENKEFSTILRDNNIEVIEHCTLVMLDYGLF
ncbi:MAG: CoA-binding protein [Marinilabiliales bacterium]|nr:MAG: CoA-binding protein [Marinilabiliales bacterium]